MNTNLTREERIRNVAAGQMVEELKGRHAYLHGVNFGREEYGVFWLRSTDTTWGHGWGRLIGYDEMFKAHCGAAADEMFGSARFTGWFGHEMDGHDRRSTNWGASHVLASPVIEVADDGKSARSYPCDEEEKEILSTADLLTLKPIIFAANMDEDGFKNHDDNAYYQAVLKAAENEEAQVVPICANIEADIAAMDPEDREIFLEDLGVSESGLDRLIKASYTLLGLISYLTCGEDECRAWTITRGTKAPKAAGKIHTDFERGFIRAEVVGFEDLDACGGSMTAAKEKGLVRSEGKEYVMQDGDVVLFRFNV